MATHYSILGVNAAAAHDDIRRAYLAEARRWHPDRFVGQSAAQARQAEASMRQVNEAWRVLGDSAKRAEYDLTLGDVSNVSSSGIRVQDGVTRVDPRLLDPRFLHERRIAQEMEISERSAFLLKAIPWGGFLVLLLAVFVFTAYARDNGAPVPVTVPGPNIGVDAGTCVRLIEGPSLLAVPCGGTSDGRVVGARFADGRCPVGTNNEVQLGEDKIVCLVR